MRKLRIIYALFALLAVSCGRDELVENEVRRPVVPGKQSSVIIEGEDGDGQGVTTRAGSRGTIQDFATARHCATSTCRYSYSVLFLEGDCKLPISQLDIKAILIFPTKLARTATYRATGKAY